MFDYYQLTVPVYTRTLNQLSHLISRAAEFAETKKIGDEVILGLRLAPDMLPFVKQIQISCDNAKFAVARLAGVEAPKHADHEASFIDLQHRINATLSFLESVPRSAFKDAGTKTITLSFMPDKPMRADFYLLSFVTPNFYFHVNMAYALLRSNGVEIGKQDYIGAI